MTTLQRVELTAIDRGTHLARVAYPDVSEGPRAAIAEKVRGTRGRLLHLFHALLHAPTVAAPWLELGTALRYRTGLSVRVRELVICQVARRTGSAYEWHHHASAAEKAGVTAEQLAALPSWRASGRYDDDDAAVLAYVDQVLDGTVDDETFKAVVERYGAEGAVELATTAAFYLANARFLAALDVEIEPSA